MSTDKATAQSGGTGLARRKYKVDKTGNERLPDINKVDIAALQLDESQDIDCDPYNCTGQHLIAAIKRKAEE